MQTLATPSLALLRPFGPSVATLPSRGRVSAVDAARQCHDAVPTSPLEGEASKAWREAPSGARRGVLPRTTVHGGHP